MKYSKKFSRFRVRRVRRDLRVCLDPPGEMDYRVCLEKRDNLENQDDKEREGFQDVMVRMGNRVGKVREDRKDPKEREGKLESKVQWGSLDYRELKDPRVNKDIKVTREKEENRVLQVHLVHPRRTEILMKRDQQVRQDQGENKASVERREHLECQEHPDRTAK